MNIRDKYEAYEKKKRIFLKADKETSKRLNIKIGEEYSIFPPPENHVEAFERLENYEGLISLEYLIDTFKNKFPINERTLNDKIKTIDEFIIEAEKINISEAFTKVGANHPKANSYEYLKLKYDYYKNENLEYYGYNYFFSPLTSLVYAEYFLFKSWLISELYKLNQVDKDESLKIKASFIDKIKKAEDLAKTTLEISLKQDFFEIDNAKINEETHKELLKIYYSNTINKYVNTRNLYKASSEQFHFLNKEAENKLTDDDRVDFIAMILTSYLTESNEVNSQFEEADLLEIFNQLKNIDEIVYETKLSELKYNAIKKLIEKFEYDKANLITTYPLVEDSWEINEELIENIRLQYSTSKLLFGCDKDNIEIVPEIQTHDYLQTHFPIDDTILKYYYAPTRLFITDADFEKMTKSGYMGNIERTLTPYPISIFGAFHSRKKIHSQLKFVIFNKKYFINNKEIKFLSDLVPYFIDYSDGFKNGFNDFEKNCITPFLNEYSDKSDFTFKIYEYVTKHIAFQHSWLNNGGSFHVNPRENNEKHITEAFEDGQKQGYFYKAWSIILGNNKVYSNYFKEYYSKDTKFSETEIKETKTILKQKPSTKVPAKFHALAYIFELLINGEKPPQDSDGNFKKDEIIKIGKERCDDSGQNFYNFVKDHYALVSSKNIKYSVYKNNWKEIVLNITNYRNEIETYIKNNSL